MAGTGKGCYIYAIAAVGEDGKTYDFTGMSGGAVSAIAVGGAAMIVSDIAPSRIRPERPQYRRPSGRAASADGRWHCVAHHFLAPSPSALRQCALCSPVIRKFWLTNYTG
jgi:hypothetical protein